MPISPEQSAKERAERDEKRRLNAEEDRWAQAHAQKVRDAETPEETAARIAERDRIARWLGLS